MRKALTAIAGFCHVIFGHCGMKTSYHSYNMRGWRDRFSVPAALIALLFGVLPLLLASAAAMGAPRKAPMSSGDDSLLIPRPGPCWGASTGADYIGGADADGHFVAPADVGGTSAIKLDSETVYADIGTGRRGDVANVALDVKGLKAGLAAPNACSPRHR